MSGGSEERPVGEDDLHAYVDGHLDERRRQEVETWLADHPGEAERLQDWTRMSDALRRAMRQAADEAVPARLGLAELHAERRRRRGAMFRRVAAAAALFACGAITGWGGARLQEGDGGGPPMADALAAHRLYAGRGAEAVEIAMPTQAALAHALSGSAGWGVPVPDLSSLGLRPLGGRVLPSEDGMAALVIYEGDGGLRLSVFIRRSRREGPAVPVITEREAPLRAAVWFRDGFGHAVVGTDAPASLLLSAAASLGG